MNRLINGNLNFNYASLIGSQGLTSDMVMDIGTGGNNLTADIAYIESHLGGSSLTGNITIGTTNANTITINSGSTTYANNEVITLKDNSITGLQFGSAGNTNMMVLDTSDISANVNLSSGTNLILNDVTDATSSTDINSALVVSGGIACAKRMVIGNIICNGNNFTGATITGTNLLVAGTTDSSSSITGAITCAGGAGISKNLYVGTSLVVAASSVLGGNMNIAGVINNSNTTASTTYATGSVILAGGLGVAGVINSNSAINTPNSMSCGGFTNNGLTNLSNTTASSSTTTGALTCAGGVGITGAINCAGIENNTNITDNTSSTGAIITSGGICCTKKLYVGGNINGAGNITVTGNMYGTNAYMTGISLATTGGTASLLSYYEEYTTLVNLWAPSGGGAWLNSTNTMTLIRIGNIVNLRIKAFNGEAMH